MPRGDKSSYTPKEKRKAGHIEQGYRRQGVSKKEAEARAWATVNKTHGKKKSKARTKTSKKKKRTSSAPKKNTRKKPRSGRASKKKK